jgi:membrane protein DedA with SNARE-associated domain
VPGRIASAKLPAVHSLTFLAAVTNQHLPGVLHTLEPTLNHYGYLAVAGLVLLEDFGIPVPGETVLILGAVYAGTGRLNVVLVGLLGFLGAVTGDNIGFAIGHFGGRRLLERYGRFILLTPERLDRATAFFERHGGKIITVARFIEGLRQANGIIAGSTGMHWAKFVAFNALGAALWVAVWVSIGYFSGSHINTIYDEATRYSTYLAIAVGVLLIAYIGRRVMRARARRRERKINTPVHDAIRVVAGKNEEEVSDVHVRVVRFTDVTRERIDALVARIEEAGGPPSGVRAKGLNLLFDEGQGTAVVLQYFDTAEDMAEGGRVFSDMDSAETPGERASVDMCESKFERTLS